jgi:hypothetical protein
VRWFGSIAPLGWLGRISYGVYLVHWPLFVFLTEHTHLSRLSQFVLVVPVSIVIAHASAVWFERPILEGRPIFGRIRFRPAAVAPVAVVLVLVGCLALPTDSGQFNADTAAGQLRAQQLKNRARAAASTTAPTVSAVAPAPTWDIFGDSVALSLALVFGDWEKTSTAMDGIGGIAQVGCGLVRGGYRKFTGIEQVPSHCDTWPTTWPQEIQRTHPQIAVVTTCQWEMVDRKLVGDTVWRSLGDPIYDARVQADLSQATDVLAAQGALVIWLTCPQFGSVDNTQDNADMLASHQPARVDRLNAIIRDVVASRPATARVVDLGGWMAPHVQDTSMRSDGEHFDDTPQDDVVSAFLAPAILSTWRAWWKTHHN